MSVGHIYVINTVLTNPPKEKITLCVCAADNLFLWINTEPRKHGVGQFPLSKGDHHYLTHDCYLDCSRLTTFPPSDLNGAKHISPIAKDLAMRIVAYLSESPPQTLSPRQLALIIENLSGL